MYKNVELRKLPADALCKVVNILEINNDWKKVMSIIPKNLHSEDFEPKYNNEQVRMIEEHAKSTNQKCSEILMDEWGTSGRVRPTLGILKEILVKAQIFRAADEIARILNESLPVRPDYGPGKPVSLNVTEILNDVSAEQRLNDMTTAVKSNSNPLCNGSTRQMKSASDMIKFSHSSTYKMPPETVHQSFGNKTTAQMKSADDLIVFSKVQPAEESMNLPDLSAMLANARSTHQQSTTPTIDSTDSRTLKSISTQSNANIGMHYPETYQTSFPNINISTGIDSAILQDTNLIHFDYGTLDDITGNFSESLIVDPKCGLKGRIGSGGFGDVFVGKDSTYGMLAVKKAHSHLAIHRRPEIAMRIFNAEVKYLSQFRHNNIVPIWGFSMNGPVPCIVCEYIDGGSLQQNIEAKHISDEIQRINIMIGTAEGLKYLHTSDKPLQNKGGNTILNGVGESDSQNSTKHFVHGDVKTANILLTRDCVPKLCDFGLAKQYDSTFVTTYPMGTSAYMAPEGLHGTITQKIDIFSFGIVLLELLTGLKPIVENNGENLNIKHYVEENSVNNDITPLLDRSVNIWVKADDVYNLARMCLEHNRKSRPTIVEVCDILNKMKNE
ncbi:interleukin-1 receptor-associated kinase 4-like [Pararge aegeria]|uniref:Jg2176 protein n=3 Tax=Pararge aegeria TaxID=116150 RepID=A0A8S4S568_9NEOP|nr:interleukin-1 receptor-associated kinase 4-like [Pararge aegeria]CAH2243070.1 jg2176 [Pararge aegeria aegeria]